MSKPLVLFLCTRNSARSQMAEAVLRKLAGDRFDAASAGVDTREIYPLTIRVMEEIGIDLDGHRPKSLMEYLGKVKVHHPIAVCTSVEKRCPRIWPFGGVS